MRIMILTTSLSAALLAGCDATPTLPVDRAAAPAGKQLVIVNPVQSWTLVTLPFRPTAINDAGVIVGSKAGDAVRWQNGVLTTLPHKTGLAGPYSAIDVTPTGVILGVGAIQNSAGWGHGLYWASTTTEPVDISGGTQILGPLGPRAAAVIVQPVAMNDAYVIVGNMATTTTQAAFRWSAASGIQNISRAPNWTAVTGLDASGYVSANERPTTDAWLPLRADPNAILAPLQTSSTQNGPYGVTSDINDAGTVVGTATPNGTTMTRFWSLDGSFSDLSIGFNDPGKLSNAGRLIEKSEATTPWTYFAGVLSQLTVPGPYAQLVGVNKCGSIIGQASPTSDIGYFWVRTNGCDVSNLGPTVSMP